MPVHWLGTAPCHDPARVGGKAANLSVLAGEFRVPPGFVVAGLPAANSPLDHETVASVHAAYDALAARVGEARPAVAVRSSAIDEDSTSASFAGQHATFLNVRGADRVVDAIARCGASAGSAGALTYRAAQGVQAAEVRTAVLVQLLVEADVAAVAFSAHPVTGSREEVVINASWGLGESVVAGLVTPDMYVVTKRGEVTERSVGAKESMTVLDAAGTREALVLPERRARLCLTDAQVREVARVAVALEERMRWPVDMECAFADGELWLLQCRPITALK